MSGNIDNKLIEKVKTDFKNKDYSLIQRSVTANGIYKASENVFLDSIQPLAFSHEIKTGKVTNQNNTGSCWMFTTLNFLRHYLESELKVDDFELSQSYSYFWSKFEKCNAFYENIIETALTPISDRYVASLLRQPQMDGGWWELAVSTIRKYGVVPSGAMKNNIVMLNFGELNRVLNRKLIKDASVLRELVASDSSQEVIKASKESMLSEIYRILAISLGNPPEKFDFVYQDKNKKQHIERELTPLEFLDKYFKINFDDYVSIADNRLVKDSDKELFEVRRSQFIDSTTYKCVTTNLSDIKSAMVEQIKSGQPVPFLCDHNDDFMTMLGHMSSEAYDIEKTFDIDLSLDKTTKSELFAIQSTHMMLITGVNIVDDKPTRWKVENSWGEERGHHGYYVMSDEWMSDYISSVTIDKKHLGRDILEAFNKTPRPIQTWDSLY